MGAEPKGRETLRQKDRDRTNPWKGVLTPPTRQPLFNCGRRSTEERESFRYGDRAYGFMVICPFCMSEI